MTKQNNALRLADEVDEVAKTFPDMAEVSACIRTQHAAIERMDALLLDALSALRHLGGWSTATHRIADAITKELL